MNEEFFAKFEAIVKAYIDWIVKVLNYWYPGLIETETEEVE